MSLRRQDLGCHTDSLARVLRPCARASSASMGLCRRPTDQAQSHCEGITQRLVQNRQFYHTLPLQAGGTRKSRRRKVEPAEAGTGFVACFVRWPHGSHSLGLFPSLQNGRKPPPMLALHQRFVLANSQLGGVHQRKQMSSLEGRFGGRTSALEACKGCRA